MTPAQSFAKLTSRLGAGKQTQGRPSRPGTASDTSCARPPHSREPARHIGAQLCRGVRSGFIGAMIVLDAWQFAFHRLFHEVEWLYKHVHVWHHRMFIPFAYGALYQHPFEMLIMDTLSGLVSVSAVGALLCDYVALVCLQLCTLSLACLVSQFLHVKRMCDQHVHVLANATCARRLLILC